MLIRKRNTVRRILIMLIIPAILVLVGACVVPPDESQDTRPTRTTEPEAAETGTNIEMNKTNESDEPAVLAKDISSGTSRTGARSPEIETSLSKIESPNTSGPDLGVRQVGLLDTCNSRPVAPNNLRIIASTPETVYLGWIDGTPCEVGYKIMRGTLIGNSGSNFIEIDNLARPFGSKSWVNHTVTMSRPNLKTRYCYQVRPYDRDGLESISNPVCEDPAVEKQLRILTQNIYGQGDVCEERATRFGDIVADAEPAYDIVGVQEYFHNWDAGTGWWSCDDDALLESITSLPNGRYRNSNNTYLFKPDGEADDYGLIGCAFSIPGCIAGSAIAEVDGGIGVFTLHPIDRDGEPPNEWEWGDGYGAREHGFIFTRIDIPFSNLTVDTYIVHLHSASDGYRYPWAPRCDRGCRQAELAQLADKISEISGESGNPVIVMGDFNIAGPISEAEFQMDNGGSVQPWAGNCCYRDILYALGDPRDLWLESHPDDPGDGGYTGGCEITDSPAMCQGDERIDYIFVLTNEDLTNSAYEIVIQDPEDVKRVGWTFGNPRRYLSDHFGVESTILIRDRWFGGSDRPVAPGGSSVFTIITEDVTKHSGADTELPKIGPRPARTGGDTEGLKP